MCGENVNRVASGGDVNGIGRTRCARRPGAENLCHVVVIGTVESTPFGALRLTEPEPVRLRIQRELTSDGATRLVLWDAVASAAVAVNVWALFPPKASEAPDETLTPDRAQGAFVTSWDQGTRLLAAYCGAPGRLNMVGVAGTRGATIASVKAPRVRTS